MGVFPQPGVRLSCGAGDILLGAPARWVVLCVAGDDRSRDRPNHASAGDAPQQPRAGIMLRCLGDVLSAALGAERPMATRSAGWISARLCGDDSLYRGAAALSPVLIARAARRSVHRAQAARDFQHTCFPADWTHRRCRALASVFDPE